LSQTAIISDIHANLPALEAVLAEIDSLYVDRIISLGDLAGYGPHINECAALLMDRNILNLMGNHDDYIVKGTDCPRSKSANIALAKQRSVIKPKIREWLAQSPLRFSDGDVRMLHGGWNDPLDEYILELRAAYFENRDGRLFISGHTHVQGQWRLQQKIYANPGSVGQPRDGDPRAAYAVLNDGVLSLRRVAYDINAYISACKNAGYPEKLSECVRAGTKVGGGITAVRVVQP
jgi:putative phosphoesterase